MSGKVKLVRGFKANAEKLAKEYRNVLGKNVHDPLCAFELANHLNISIYTPAEIFSAASSEHQFSGTNNEIFGWSALTMTTGNKNKIIIHNNFHSSTRQQSNIMHELAHIICDHKYADDRLLNIPIGMRDYNPVFEEEANCLGSTIQLPREGLVWAKKKNLTNLEISQVFNASLEMINYRLRISGILRQFSHYKKSDL